MILRVGMVGCLLLLTACGERGVPETKIVDPAQEALKTNQQDMTRMAVQDYFRKEALTPSSGSSVPATLPKDYIPPPKDGWVADWGIWANQSDQEAIKLYKGIPKELALKYVFGEPRRELVVFTDPYNQDDRRLYRILDDATETMDAVVYVFPLPGKLAVGNVQRILCAANPEKAWWNWMMMLAPKRIDATAAATPRLAQEEELRLWGVWEKQHPPMLSCEDKERASRIATLATDLGVSHTPTLLFANGRAWPSAVLDWSDVEQNWNYVHVRQGIKVHGEE